ncbi:MAG: sulfatase activating formylglycine-generating enzyme [Phenylobacterium sp.]|jgi:formylglycine-generating enzyme required for sulfatase activity
MSSSLKALLKSPKMPAAASMLVLLLILLLAMVRQFGYTLDDMVYFAATERELGGESDPLLDTLRQQETLNIDDVLGLLPQQQEFTPQKRLFVSRYEVTNTQYRAFIRWLQRNPTAVADVADVGIDQNHQFNPTSLRDIKYNHAKQPIINLDWYDADAFCRFINMRLPTASEFEAIFTLEAGSQAERQTPVVAGVGVVASELEGKEVIPHQVGSDSTGRGIFFDIIGNVMEWVQPENGQHFLMGHSYKQSAQQSSKDTLYPWQRHHASANDFANDFGVRCVYEAPTLNFKLNPRKPPIASKDGVNCWNTLAHVGPTGFDLIHKRTRTAANPSVVQIPVTALPPQLCELPIKSYQLGPPETVNTVDVIHQYPAGYAFYLLGRKPQPTKLAAFWLDSREVSVNQFSEFMALSGSVKKLYAHPEEPHHAPHIPLNWPQQWQQHNKNTPVIGADWWSAFAYCSWQNKRLPFATEWESAARSSDDRMYAWGSLELKSSSLEHQDNSLEPKDNSPEGITGLTRTVSEWTASLMAGSDAAVVKGGSGFYDWRVFGRAYVELKLPRNIRSSAVGFRCAREG